jgi:cation transporter-like permease
MEPGIPSPKGLVARIVLTIITVSAFLVGSLIYVAFYTDGFTLFQKIVAVLVALILAVTIVSIAWVTWAGRRGMIKSWWNE